MSSMPRIDKNNPILDSAFNSPVQLSLAKLLEMLRRHFGMDVAFIAKFAEGRRTTMLIDAREDQQGINCGFSHPSEETYCRKIADGELPAVIPDTEQNAITRKMPVTRELGIGAYMGVPIALSNGEVYGTLCCMKYAADTQLKKRDAALLRFISEVAAQKIEESEALELERTEIRERIEYVIAENAFEMHYQPIWGINEGGVTSFEALARFRTEPYLTPDIWFQQAEQVGRRDYLEAMAIRAALQKLPELPEGCSLNVNASPEAIMSGAVEEVVMAASPHRIVLEVTEHSKIRDYGQFRRAIDAMRARGVRLAIDDAGAGYASFQHVMELEPDVIKLDLSLIRDIHQSTKKQAMAAALISYARHANAEVVAEGVECLAEFALLTRLGADKVQGYYIGKPSPTLVFDCF